MPISDLDLILITQIKLTDNHKAFEKLVLKYQSKVRRLFLNLTSRDKSLADDLAQETFIKVYLNLNRFRTTSKFSTWLYRIAYNTYVDYKRKNKIIFEDISLCEKLENSQLFLPNHDLMKALSILNEKEKELIILNYIEDCSHQEISTITGLPLGTVKTIIKRGREKLKNHLSNNL